MNPLAHQKMCQVNDTCSHGDNGCHLAASCYHYEINISAGEVVITIMMTIDINTLIDL
jgi:hypothetical protein